MIFACKLIIKLYSYPLSCIDINSNGSGEMKKKLLAGLITGFFIWEMRPADDVIIENLIEF